MLLSVTLRNNGANVHEECDPVVEFANEQKGEGGKAEEESGHKYQT